MSRPELTPLEREEQVDALIEESHARPVVIFKFSRTCGTSAYAADELHTFLAREPVDARVAVVTVQTHRSVSNTVAARLGVRHESPQFIVLRGGTVTWHGSHFRASAGELSAALTQAAGAR